VQANCHLDVEAHGVRLDGRERGQECQELYGINEGRKVRSLPIHCNIILLKYNVEPPIVTRCVIVWGWCSNLASDQITTYLDLKGNYGRY